MKKKKLEGNSSKVFPKSGLVLSDVTKTGTESQKLHWFNEESVYISPKMHERNIQNVSESNSFPTCLKTLFPDKTIPKI